MLTRVFLLIPLHTNSMFTHYRNKAYGEITSKATSVSAQTNGEGDDSGLWISNWIGASRSNKQTMSPKWIGGNNRRCKISEEKEKTSGSDLGKLTQEETNKR